MAGLSARMMIGAAVAVVIGFGTAASGGAVESYGSLPPAVVVDGNGQGVGALPACTVLAAGDVGGTGMIPGTKPLDCATVGIDGFSKAVLALEAPQSLSGLSLVPETEFDLLQTDLRLWNESLAGRLNFAARKAKARGDMAEYQRLYAEYCEALEQGMDRRALLGKKADGGR
ncbi:MAG: hypothetical protein WCI74_15790, partial [Actinomycetes bacterium]